MKVVARWIGGTTALVTGSTAPIAWTARLRFDHGGVAMGPPRIPPRRGYGIHTLKVGGAHRLPPSAREASGGEGRLGRSPSGVGGASPRRFVDDQARVSMAALAQPPHHPRHPRASPSHPPTPTPPRHSASPSGGREEREADMCESGSPFGRGVRAAEAQRVRTVAGTHATGRPLPTYVASAGGEWIEASWSW